MCQSYCFFLVVLLLGLLVGQKNTKKIGFFDDFELLIFSFFGQKSRVNNLGMVESITWPFFGPKFCPERWPSYYPTFFHTFFLLVFFQKSHSPCRKKNIFEKQKNNKKNQKTDGQVIDFWWPSNQPYSIYIYIYTLQFYIFFFSSDWQSRYFKTATAGALWMVVIPKSECYYLRHSAPRPSVRRWFRHLSAGFFSRRVLVAGALTCKSGICQEDVSSPPLGTRIAILVALYRPHF